MMTRYPVGNHGEKPSETLVRFLVEQALGVRVCCYDDRRGVSRPDAIIHREGGVPLEIVSDPLKSENQLLGALDRIGRRTQFDGLEHGYRVCLKPPARVKDLGWLKELLRELERPETSARVRPESDYYMFIEPERSLSPGEIRFTIGSGGGHPIPDGLGVVTAACDVLAQTHYADVARKLNGFGGVERHAVLIVDAEKDPTFGWLREATPVDVHPLPVPRLAGEITHLWITPRYIPGLTMMWSANSGWRGTEWVWGHPVAALNDWDDPVCRDDHKPGGSRSPRAISPE